MKVRLIKSAHLPVPAGTKIELPDSRALLLIRAGIAISAEPKKPTVVETAVLEPAETAAEPVQPAPNKKSTKKK